MNHELYHHFKFLYKCQKLPKINQLFPNFSKSIEDLSRKRGRIYFTFMLILKKTAQLIVYLRTMANPYPVTSNGFWILKISTAVFEKLRRKFENQLICRHILFFQILKGTNNMKLKSRIFWYLTFFAFR